MTFDYNQALDLAIETCIAAGKDDQTGQHAAALPLEDHHAHDLLITALVDLVTALSSMRAEDGRLPDPEATIHVAAHLVHASRTDP